NAIPGVNRDLADPKYAFDKHNAPYGSTYGKNVLGLGRLSRIATWPDENSAESNAGAPYACSAAQPEFCGKNVCVGGGNDGSACDASDSCPNGKCVGSAVAGVKVQGKNLADARDSISNLFAKTFKVKERSLSGSWIDGSGYDVRATTGQAPRIRAVIPTVDGFGEVTYIDGPSINFIPPRPNIVGAPANKVIALGGVAQAFIRFYAYNPNGEQMPLRKIRIDWSGNGFEESEGDREFGRDGIEAYANRKAVCNNNDFGDGGDGCLAQYFEFSGLFLSGPSQPGWRGGPPLGINCGITGIPAGDPMAAWNGYNGPCNRITPKVQVIDNWGVCDSGCPGGACTAYSSGINVDRCQGDNADTNTYHGWKAGPELIILPVGAQPPS
ncbi:MAG: hypothetical protein AAB817_02130, partial [Patescibacteria group bacterium]